MGRTVSVGIGLFGLGTALLSAVAPAVAIGMAVTETLPPGPAVAVEVALALDLVMPILWFVSGLLGIIAFLSLRRPGTLAVAVVTGGLIALSFLEMLVVYGFTALVAWAFHHPGGYIW